MRLPFTQRYGSADIDEPLKIPHTDPISAERISQKLLQYLSEVPAVREILIVCIGTDRSTGDSLGPLVGSRLKQLGFPENRLFGTLDHPVHAMNLVDILNHINSLYHHPYIVAVDACLGQSSSVGHIQLGSGPVKPGAGVNKDLPPVGDIHITGIVNVGGFMEYFVLQNTRLSIVFNMAEVISDAVFRAHRKLLAASSATIATLD